MYRSRDALPHWFSVFEELRLNIRLSPKNMRLLTKLQPIFPGGCVSKTAGRTLAPTAPFDYRNKVENTGTVRSLLMESTNVDSAATVSVSIIPADRCELLSSSVTAVMVPPDASCTVPTSSVTLQYHSVDVVASTDVTQSEVLIITADQLQQLGLDASVLPPVTTSDDSHHDTSVPCYNVSKPCDSVSVSSRELPTSVGMNQSATAAVTKSPNLIGRAFASAVGISVDELSSFGDLEPADNDEWRLPASTGSQVTDSVAAAVTFSNNITVKALEQSITTSVTNVSLAFANSIGSSENKSVFTSCDVDVSSLDITMFNSASLLSPALPSQPCDDHTNNDSTLATPIKMVYNRDDDPARPLPAAETQIPASDRMLSCATGSTTVTYSQCLVSSNDPDVRVFDTSSAFSGSLESNVFPSTVGSDAAVSAASVSSSVSFSSLVPFPSPVHGMALIPAAPQQIAVVPGSNDIRCASVMCSASLPLPLPAGPHTMSLPSSSLHRTKQIPMQHARSPSKCVPSTRRPILPRSEPEPPFSPSKFLCSLSPKKSAQKKSAAKISSKALSAIAPKAIVAKCHLSPVKQAAASITARAKRLQSSPSRGVWYTAAKTKTSESPSSLMRPTTTVVVNSPDARMLVNDEEDEELASVEGEEQNTDVDSQLEDEVEEDSSTQQSPSS